MGITPLCLDVILNVIRILLTRLFCLFVLMLNVPVNNFSVMSGRSNGEESALLKDKTRRMYVSSLPSIISNPRLLAPESDALPLNHRAPLDEVV